ncbi:dTMP kinase [Guptibacillus hwajinpoensis]|uniref:Thymidylate kinase n=1 Tax=Guptibacillus hwajinpoensis TaxID=208199 RepID=A0ABU0K6Z0_9BACL|nr:dTMP kinase [Alkalihalobacillus hemicentroti]MDQ0485115.1 dTMP kinase [Alkalihalobacillus hemicentroti]
MRGLFITFEGPDGAGKSTQVQKLSNYLTEEGIPFIHTREPGGTAISDQIRSLILNPVHKEMVDETEVLLYAASRSQHVKEKIVPALEQGYIVLCDRFVDASIAYQGVGLGLDVEKIKLINEFATGGLTPDRSYMIDLPVSVGRERMAARNQLDRIEQKGTAYHETVRGAFLELYEEQQERITLINGENNVEEIFRNIKKDFISLWDNYCKNN